MDFAHDGFGNNISHRVQGTAGASFNNFDFPALATNQIPAMTTTGGLTGWSMNPQGRAIQIGTGTSTGRTLGLGWDGLGQLASVTSAAGTQRYAYAPTGLRVQVQDSLSPARNRRYAYSSGGLLMSEFTQAGWKRDVVYLGSEAVAEVDGAGVHELHNDHLGTPRIVTSRATRRIEGRQAFGPYGEVLAAQTEGYRPLTGYTGHLQTEDTGLIYMRGRYYSPAWHRFLNSDQGADPSTWNQVAYVGGSPFMAIDPSGMRLLWRRCTRTTITTFDKDGNLTGSVTFDPVCIERIIPEAGDYQEGDLGGSPEDPQTPQSPKPKVDCNTVLPDGRTVGDYVRQYRSQLQSIANDQMQDPMGSASPGALSGAMFSIANVGGPIDFKRKFRGQANGGMLGQAGNFAYYAIGSGIIPTFELDAGAAGYSLYSLIFGGKKFSDITWRGIDTSAASVRDLALAANGCK